VPGLAALADNLGGTVRKPSMSCSAIAVLLAAGAIRVTQTITVKVNSDVTDVRPAPPTVPVTG